jgi:cellulose synthase/poly-beta-1,6-N-acetylglucosamine synthase-like glycosyltransferase
MSFHDGADALELYLARRFLPLEDGTVALADWRAENVAWIAEAFPGAERVFLTPAELNAQVVSRFGARLTDSAIHSLDRREPELSARRVVTRGQAATLAAVAAMLVALAVLAPMLLTRAVDALMVLLFLIGVFFRAVLAWLGAGTRKTQHEPVADAELPLYTILVPLYREAHILPSLTRALLALDYPRDRLDIKLIVEEDDDETAGACMALDAPLEVVRVPASLPRTKPKAVNFALPFARGEFLVIYDAEDRPEPDQLRKAVAAFRALPRDMACLQARLAFYNARESWLTSQAAADYHLWFGALLEGLARIRVPIPLGGTSNHFRAQVLKEIGAWDPFNVTEDADLGIRLAQHGRRVAMLDSTTHEETPAHFAVWLRQRSRWLKGYMQTWLVHGRNTRRLYARAGMRGVAAFHLFIGGAVLSALVNPLLWIVCILALLCPGWIDPAVAKASAAGAFGANAVLSLVTAAVALRSGERRLGLSGITVTFYWLLISLAAWRALIHLVVKPFHWEKTAHGSSAQAEAGDA